MSAGGGRGSGAQLECHLRRLPRAADRRPEDWTDVEAFERHLRSDQFAQLLAVLELAAEPPTLECRLISESRGLDYVAAVRGVAAWTDERRGG